MKKNILYFAALLLSQVINAQGVWLKKANAPNLYSVAVSLSIGNNGYVLTTSWEFWEWNQSSNTWIRKADFPGAKRSSAAAFTISTKGYIGTGATP